MKLNERLKKLIDNYLEQKENLSPYLFEGEDSYRITISEKEEMIKYCQKKIFIFKVSAIIYSISGIIIPVLSLGLTYIFLEKIYEKDIVSYGLSFVIFFIMLNFFNRRYWRTGREKSSYQLLLKTLKDVK